MDNKNRSARERGSTRKVFAFVSLVSFAVIQTGLTLVFAVHATAQRGQPPGPPPTPRASAPIDITGNWVSVVTEDWRWRMLMPRKGDYSSVPLSAEGRKVADSWDPANAAADGCKPYGAAAIMRVPGRLRVAWEKRHHVEDRG